MKLNTFFRVLKIKSGQIRKNRKGIAKTYVSLFLAMFLVVGLTAAWFTSKEDISINTQEFQMAGSDSIRDSQLQTLQTEVVIPNFKLEEASSVDGRNIFFPASFDNNVSDSNNSTMETQTGEMVYREGNAGDKNKLYAYAKTDINASGSNTNVWIKGYKVKLRNPSNNTETVYRDEMEFHYNTNNIPDKQLFPASCPVRIAVIDDSGHTPKIFDPSAKVKSNHYVTNTDAVYSINTQGVPHTQTTKLDAFSSYYYGTGNPLFVVEAGHKITLTVVAWLEGTHPHAAEYCGQELYVELEIETNVSEMEYIYLHDWTVGDTENGISSSNYAQAQTRSSGHWLAGDSLVAMSYYDTVAQTYKTTIMTIDGSDSTYGGTVYKAAIPKYVLTDISFYRLNDSYTDVHYGLVFNSWHTRTGVNDQLHSDIKNSSWKVLGDLAESRKIGSMTYSHYFAIRGNGYGVVAHQETDANFIKWLSPCIGYWGTSSGPIGYTGGGSSGGGSSGGGSSGGGSSGGGSSSITNLNIKLGIPDGGTFSGNWYRNDIGSNGNYDMYAIFSNSGGSNPWRIKMTAASDASSVSLSTFTDSRFSTSTQIIGFVPVNRNDNTEKSTVGISYWTLQSNYNKNFTLTSATWATG